MGASPDLVAVSPQLGVRTRQHFCVEYHVVMAGLNLARHSPSNLHRVLQYLSKPSHWHMLVRVNLAQKHRVEKIRNVIHTRDFWFLLSPYNIACDASSSWCVGVRQDDPRRSRGHGRPESARHMSARYSHTAQTHTPGHGHKVIASVIIAGTCIATSVELRQCAPQPRSSIDNTLCCAKQPTQNDMRCVTTFAFV